MREDMGGNARDLHPNVRDRCRQSFLWPLVCVRLSILFRLIPFSISFQLVCVACFHILRFRSAPFHLHGSVEVLHDEVAGNAAQALYCRCPDDPRAVEGLQSVLDMRAVRYLERRAAFMVFVLMFKVVVFVSKLVPCAFVLVLCSSWCSEDVVEASNESFAKKSPPATLPHTNSSVPRTYTPLH